MKRYLVTITGRANLGYKGNKLRERDLCCSYVYGKNKAEAISKFWEQIKESSGLKGFERRDFKITAERWEKEVDLDVNGNPLTESNPEPLGDIKLSDFFSITEMLLMENSEPEWAYYHNNDLIWASSKRFSKDELLRMYANGYFMPYLTDKRKNLSRIQLKEYKTMGNTERCQNLWKQIEALDEEIARLFMNGARM